MKVDLYLSFVSFILAADIARTADVHKISVTSKPSAAGDATDLEISLHVDQGVEKVLLKKVETIFSEDLEVRECDGKECKESTPEEGELEAFRKCSFEGKLASDPNSVVHVTGCHENESVDISIISDKANLTSNMYRRNRDGTIAVADSADGLIFTDDSIETKALITTKYNDYTDYDGGDHRCASGMRPLVYTRYACIYGEPTKTCRDKDPVPSKKIYQEKTIETAVFIDHHLYKLMASRIRTTNPTRIKRALDKMVYKVLFGAETFLRHRTFTDKGGFKIKVKKIEEFTSPMEDWDHTWQLIQLLSKFQKYCNKVNKACDADPRSYDAMILLTGRYFRYAGYAGKGTVCRIAPTIALSMKIDYNGNPTSTMPLLLAHEFGHLLGSDHDGRQRATQCNTGKFLMSPAVGGSMTKWSSCTKKLVDEHLENMDKKNVNCLYT